MRMELIQPFIDAADAVFSESLQAPAKIVDLSMDENAYRRKGVAAVIAIKGDIEGRVVLDLSPEVAVKIASQLAGAEVADSEQVVRETVCELANMLCGSLASRLESDESFDLTSPELRRAANVAGVDSESLPAARQSFELENGILTVTLRICV